VKNVYLVPGFLASDLGILATGEKLWWDPSVYTVLGLGAMRLKADGLTPAPPNGEQMAPDSIPQNPWGLLALTLKYQLDPREWSIAVGPYDWRLDLQRAAKSLSDNIHRNSSVTEPATIVGHSAGGIIAALAYRNLVADHSENLVRRIVTIGTPFQGSYGPINWLNGSGASISEILRVSTFPAPTSVKPFVKWSLDWLNALFLTWPATYQLIPSLAGSEAAADPNRALLYQLANYPDYAQPSQARLDDAKNVFQPLLQGADTFPPAWVATYVYGTGFPTAHRLNTATIPLDLLKLGSTNAGDGVVTVESATRSPGLIVGTKSGHSSIPLNITISGLLAKLIVDPRGPPDPPPTPIEDKADYSKLVTDPPQSDNVSGLQCLDGHCLVPPGNDSWRFVI